MKLNADIVFKGIRRAYSAEIYGPKTTEMNLSRPEFYMEGDNTFQRDHLYLATVEHLPKRPQIQQNAALICIGDNLNLTFYKERMCVIVISSKADFFRVHQYVHSLFDYYDGWEKALYQDLLDDNDIRALLLDSQSIFNCPIYVLDNSFRIIASTQSTLASSWSLSDSGTLNVSSIDTFLSEHELMMEKKNALKLEVTDKKILCVNLFNRNDEYEGCLCIEMINNEFTDGEDRLAEFLAEIIQKAIQKSPLLINDSAATIKKVMQNLVSEMPLSYSQRMLLNSSNRKNTYVCLYMRNRGTHRQLPLSYICDTFEEAFEDSYAFVQDGSVIAFLDTDTLSPGYNTDYRIQLNKRLTEFIKKMNLCVGISNQFNDLLNIRIHYLQALSAVENGLLLDSNGNFFYFASYALTEMIINSLGNLPVEAYFPNGLAEIFEHDRNSGVSYIETLKVFLEENMSYTTTAQKLYIHRSTLIDRISRIEKELNISLKDSDHRLQLEILLKALALEEIIRNQ